MAAVPVPPSPPSPPTPLHEDQRLQALQRWQSGWHDTEVARATALVTACAQALGTPQAAFGWLGADTWQALVWSAPSPRVLEAPPCPRIQTPCAYAMVQCDAPWQVSDLQADARWATSAWLQPHGWRGYAGMAVRDEHGWPLATLSVFDTQARTWSDAELQLLQHLASAATAIAEAGALRTELAQQRVTDTLTGLNNRPFFVQTLEIELGHAMRTGETFTVLHMDLDGFKAVKDGFGHGAGEAVLCEVAARLQRCVRQGDVVSRFGGDEFGIIMRHGGEEAAQVLAKRIVKAVCAPIALPSGDEIGVGVSVGMAAYDDSIFNVQALLQRAENEMYRTKQLNEKRWKMFVGLR